MQSLAGRNSSHRKTGHRAPGRDGQWRVASRTRVAARQHTLAVDELSTRRGPGHSKVLYIALVVSVSYRVHTHVRTTHTHVHVVAVHDFTSYTLNDSVQFVWSGGQGPTHTPTLSHTTYAINTHVLNLCG